MMAPVAFADIAVGPGELRLGDERLPLRPDPGAPDGAGDAAVEITWQGIPYRLRAWTFRERRRLLGAHLGADGELDVAALTGAALARLCTPVPESAADREIVGLAALAWSAGAGGSAPAPVPGVGPDAQLVRLAAATGWRPRDIDGALAADVDRWFAELPGVAAVSFPVAAPVEPTASEDTTFRTFRLEG
jgi:hypothetical protein